MAGWAADDLVRVEGADEVRIASRRADGSLRKAITIWVVRVDDDVYVRSAYGPENPWFVRARASGSGQLTVGGTRHEVTFAVPGPEVDEAVTAAFHAKYDRYPARIVATVVSEVAAACTLRVDRA
jgi:hypothetical protein